MTERSYTLELRSELAASADAIWHTVGTMAGVNAELGPWVHMTTPAHAAALRLEDAPLGQPLFASWVLLCGIPIDRHSFLLERVDAPRGFRERSTSWLEASWEHERLLEPAGADACVVTDRLVFRPRLALLGPLVARVIALVFRHRHRQLRRRFGSVTG